MIYLEKPTNFKKDLHVVSCLIELSNKDEEDSKKYLFLKTNKSKKDTSNLWGIPAGKVKKGEDLVDAVKREIFEETEISLNIKKIKFIKRIYIKQEKKEFIYDMYYSKVKSKKVKLSKEHSEYRWLTLKESQKMKLIEDEIECNNIFLQWKKTINDQ